MKEEGGRRRGEGRGSDASLLAGELNVVLSW